MTGKAKSTRWEAANRKHTLGAMQAYPWDSQRRKLRCEGIVDSDSQGRWHCTARRMPTVTWGERMAAEAARDALRIEQAHASARERLNVHSRPRSRSPALTYRKHDRENPEPDAHQARPSNISLGLASLPILLVRTGSLPTAPDGREEPANSLEISIAGAFRALARLFAAIASTLNALSACPEQHQHRTSSRELPPHHAHGSAHAYQCSLLKEHKVLPSASNVPSAEHTPSCRRSLGFSPQSVQRNLDRQADSLFARKQDTQTVQRLVKQREVHQQQHQRSPVSYQRSRPLLTNHVLPAWNDDAHSEYTPRSTSQHRGRLLSNASKTDKWDARASLIPQRRSKEQRRREYWHARPYHVPSEGADYDDGEDSTESIQKQSEDELDLDYDESIEAGGSMSGSDCDESQSHKHDQGLASSATALRMRRRASSVDDDSPGVSSEADQCDPKLNEELETLVDKFVARAADRSVANVERHVAEARAAGDDADFTFPSTHMANSPNSWLGQSVARAVAQHARGHGECS